MAPGMALVQNLKNAAYCQTVYSGASAANFAARFAAVDPRLPGDLTNAWRRDRLATRIPRKFEAWRDGGRPTRRMDPRTPAREVL